MTTFQWEGLSAQGRRLSGQMRAANREAVLAQLRSRGVVPLPASVVDRRAEGRGLNRALSLRRKVRQRDIALFARQLAAMIAAGLPVVEGLDILAQRSGDPALQAILERVKRDVESGVPLADALRRHPRAFGDLFVNMVAVASLGALGTFSAIGSAHGEGTRNFGEVPC
jgi:type IV pilus assembly protein PilC